MDDKEKKELRKKNIIYSLVLLGLVGAVFIYRNYMVENRQEVVVQGVAMGVVPYTVKYIMEEPADYSSEVASLLKRFNESLSTYDPASEISRFNKGMQLVFESGFFYPVLAESQRIYERTSGAFDPTVMPLVNAWGFGPEKGAELKTSNLDSLKALVGFKKITFTRDSVAKDTTGVQLDFSAIAKGYAVDLVADLLNSKGVSSYMVEIGGEVVCMGTNVEGEPWLIGINNPEYEEKGGDFLTAKIQLVNGALATSGNYYNFYVKDGKKYAHTISPETGMPVQHNLLSASVVAKKCITSDAFATAFMVMGKDEAIKIIEAEEELEALLIYDENGEIKSWVSPGLQPFLLK